MKPEDRATTSPASNIDLQFRVFDTLSDEEKKKLCSELSRSLKIRKSSFSMVHVCRNDYWNNHNR